MNSAMLASTACDANPSRGALDSRVRRARPSLL